MAAKTQTSLRLWHPELFSGQYDVSWLVYCVVGQLLSTNTVATRTWEVQRNFLLTPHSPFRDSYTENSVVWLLQTEKNMMIYDLTLSSEVMFLTHTSFPLPLPPWPSSITFYLAVGLTALSFVLERKEGLLDRCWVAGERSKFTLLLQSHTNTKAVSHFHFYHCTK